jgi:hypothetical protein
LPARNAGVPLLVPVDRLRNGGIEARQFELTIKRLMQDRVPVALSLTGMRGSGDSEACATTALQRFCEYLRSLLCHVAYDPASISLCLRSHQLPLQAFSLISNSVLGQGPRYVYLDGIQMRRQHNAAVQALSEQNWQFLWRHRRAGAEVLPVYGGLVRSACRLLSDEVAGAVLPGSATVVPASSAWLSLELPLCSFVNDAGQFDWPGLSRTIARAIAASDRMHDGLSWPCWRQLADAKLHRRLAVFVTGLGDLAVRCGQDPSGFGTLNWLNDIVVGVRRELHLASTLLARQHGPLPAVARNDPSASLRAGPTRDRWRSHWQSAVRTYALRHRNLLVLSPYAVMPEKSPSTACFADLLPVIRHADAWCFSTTQQFDGWHIDAYRRFHERAWALIQGHNEGCAVAAGV